jgi:hypothetical protein
VTLTAGEVHAPPARSHGSRRFRKHFLNHGALRHPRTGDDIDIDREFVAQMQANFRARVSGPVPVQLGGPRDEHNESPELSIGTVVGIESDGRKVFALLDIDRRADALGRTLLGCSASLHVDFIDLGTCTRVGPTLLHLLTTNWPHIIGLDGYEELSTPVELSASSRPRPAQSRWTDDSTAKFLASLRGQQPATVAAARVATSLALTRTRQEGDIARLTVMAEEMGLCGPSVRPVHGFPALGP